MCFAGFDSDVVPAVQLQAAAADHHVQAEQGEGVRGGRSAAGVQKGRTTTTPPPPLVHTDGCNFRDVSVSLSSARWLLCQEMLGDAWTSVAGRRRSVSTLSLAPLPQDWWEWVM